LRNVLFMGYYFLLFSAVIYAFPHINSIPGVGRFLRSISTIGTYILGTIVVSVLLFGPSVFLLFAKKPKHLDSMTREEKLRWYANLKVLRKEIEKPL
jgi:hypothetical protein